MEESGFIENLIENVLEHALFFVLLFAVITILNKAISYVISRFFKVLYFKAKTNDKKTQRNRFDTLANAIKKLTTIILWIIVIIAILAHFRVSETLIVSVAGAIGLFLGVVAKDTMIDLFAGFMALVENQYALGDIISVDDKYSGLVEDITLRTIVLRNIDGNVHIIPHGQAKTVTNMTYDFSRVKLDIAVAYKSDLKQVERIVNKIGESLAKDKDWKKLFIKPIHFDRTLKFDDSAILVRVIGDVQPGKQWVVSGEYYNRLKAAFDENKIEIPFPQRKVWLENNK